MESNSIFRKKNKSQINETISATVDTRTLLPDIDTERPSSKKFKGLVMVSLAKKLTYSFALNEKYQENDWPALKTIPTMPSFKAMSRTTRSEIAAKICRAGRTPSQSLTAVMGVTARQIGAIRRWWNPDWRAQEYQY